MKKIFYTFPLLILFIFTARAQTTETLNWTRLESDAKDFSLALPTNFEVFFDPNEVDGFYGSLKNAKKLKITDIRYVTAFYGGASFLVESYKTNLPEAINSYYPQASAVQEIRDFSLSGFEGKIATRFTENTYSLQIVAGRADRIYRIFGGARDKNNEALKYFLSSLKLSDKNLFVLESELKNRVRENSVAISTLKETPFLLETEEAQKQIDEIKIADKNARPVFLFMPQPKYTNEGRQVNARGTVTMSVTFSENGNVDKITVLSGLPNGLTESAVRAARLLRFLPLEIDGKPVTIAKKISYSFTIY